MTTHDTWLLGAELAAPLHPLVEPSLFYDPPYERPLEDEFAWHLVKYLSPITSLLYQERIDTACGNFWVDFVVEQSGRRVGFEIGAMGTEDDAATPLRDALLLGTGHLDALYRFRGADLLYRLHDCLYAVAQWEPALFSERGRINLARLATPEAQVRSVARSRCEARIVYEAPALTDELDGEGFDWPAGAPDELVISRLSRQHPGVWLSDYERARAHFGLTDDVEARRWARSA